ncbi:MAG: hypothetical protein V7750_04205 [Sneathiella sp.]
MEHLSKTDFTLRQYYREKYGKSAIVKLNKDAEYCNRQGDLQRRNRLLRVRDELILDDQYPVDRNI